jgi:hypothetical protein
MFTAVAARPKLTVVALAGKILPVAAVVRMLPDSTYRSPRTITLPELSGIGVPASPYKLVELPELLDVDIVFNPYLMLY